MAFAGGESPVLSAEMLAMKMESLKNCEDFRFVVKSQDGKDEEIIAVLFDLVTASKYFRKTYRACSKSLKLRFTEPSPFIFKLFVEFTHFCTIVSPIDKVEDVVALALLSVKFEVDPLKKYLAPILEKLVTVDNVWQTLSAVVDIPELAVVCSAKVLSSETARCLAHPSFLKSASTESLVFLLKIEALNIESELELLEACVRLANAQTKKESILLMGAVLPHLRLLTLPSEQLFPLSKYLTDAEKLFLSKQAFFKEDKLDVPLRLNTVTAARTLASNNLQTVAIIPKNMATGDDVIGQALYSTHLSQPTKLTVVLMVKKNLILKGVQVLTRANNNPDYRPELDSKNVKRFKPCLDYEEDLTVEVNSCVEYNTKNLFSKRFRGKMVQNSCFAVNFDKDVFVPKGVQCLVSVTVKEKLKYQIFPEPTIMQSFKAANCSAFDLVSLETKTCREWVDSSGKNNVSYQRLKTVTCIIKSLSFVLAD